MPMRDELGLCWSRAMWREHATDKFENSHFLRWV